MLLSKAAKQFNVSTRKLCEILQLNGSTEAKSPIYQLNQFEYKILENKFNEFHIENLNISKNIIETKLKNDKIEKIEIIEKIEKNYHILKERAKNIVLFQILPLIQEQKLKINNLFDEKFYFTLRNCGTKTTLELIDFFIKILDNNFETISDEDLLMKSYTDLEWFNSQNLISLIEVNKNKLSVRTNSSLTHVKDDIESNPTNIFKYLNIEQAKKIPFIGSKSAEELTKFIFEIIQKIGDSKHNLNELEFDIKFETLLISLRIDLGKFENQKYKSVKYLELFEAVLYNEIGEKKISIFNDFLNGQNYEEIAVKHNLTRERIRQIVYKIKTTIVEKHEDFRAKLGGTYISLIDEWEKTKNLDYAQILELNTTSLNDKLIALIINPNISINGSDTFFYSEELSEVINVKKFVKKVEDLNSKVEEDFKISLAGLAYSFFFKKPENSERMPTLEDHLQELESIVYTKTGLMTNSDGELIFTRNTKIKKHEIIQEILESQGKPMHLEDISKLTGIKEDNLRSTVLKEKQLFVNTAFSTYGLKKWEDEGKIKGGLIIDLIFEYLNSKAEPSHIYQIFKHIKQFRDTNERSLDGLIKSDTQHRFLKLGAGFYGLSGVHDDFEYKVFKSLPGSWHNHLNKNYKGINVNLDQFIKKEQLKFNTIELVVKANVEKRIDQGDIKIDDKGMLIFKKYVHSPNSGRPKRIE